MFRRSASICELIDAKRKKIVFLQETLYLWEILNIIYNMKTKSFLLCLVLAVSANAQVVYHDAFAFPLLGKATETPGSVQPLSNPSVPPFVSPYISLVDWEEVSLPPPPFVQAVLSVFLPAR